MIMLTLVTKAGFTAKKAGHIRYIWVCNHFWAQHLGYHAPFMLTLLHDNIL